MVDLELPGGCALARVDMHIVSECNARDVIGECRVDSRH